MTDHAKRLAEIEALVTIAAASPWTAWRLVRDHMEWLLAEIRAAGDALTAAGILEDMGSLAERAALLHHDADQQTSLSTRMMSEREDASEALAVAGVPDDGRALAERVKALAEKTTPRRCDDCGGTNAPHGHRFGCGMESEDEPFTGLDNFEASFGSGREAWNTPEGRRFIREMRGGLDDCGVPPEPDIEPAVGDLPPEAR